MGGQRFAADDRQPQDRHRAKLQKTDAMSSDRSPGLPIRAGKISSSFGGSGLTLPAKQVPEERRAQHGAPACEAMRRDGAQGIHPRV
jgi:hypothetical protein